MQCSVPDHPELLIVAPKELRKSYRLCARLSDLGVFFAFEGAYELPRELQESLAGFKAVVLAEEKAEADAVRLRAFEEGGGHVTVMAEEDWDQESTIERIPGKGGLRLDHPGMIARLHAVPDELVLESCLHFSMIYFRPDWHDVLRYNIECLAEAYDVLRRQEILDHCGTLVRVALDARPEIPASCDHVACVYAMLRYAELSGSDDILPPCHDVVDKFLARATYYRGVISNFTRQDERNLLRAEIAFQFCPAVARLGRHTGDQRYLEEAVEQLFAQDRELRDEATGLWYLGRGPAGLTPSLWARGCAFSFRGVVDTLSELDDSHPRRGELVELATTMAASLREFQDENGELRQVLDEPFTRPESSSTAWTVAGWIKCRRLGLLDESYDESIRLGWLAVKRRTWAGLSTRVCGGVTSSMDPDYYRFRHFLGPSYGHFNLLAAIEVARMGEAWPLPSCGPD